jgi:hypothetical protein
LKAAPIVWSESEERFRWRASSVGEIGIGLGVGLEIYQVMKVHPIELGTEHPLDPPLARLCLSLLLVLPPVLPWSSRKCICMSTSGPPST